MGAARVWILELVYPLGEGVVVHLLLGVQLRLAKWLGDDLSELCEWLVGCYRVWGGW
jgi:hypothetical protein